MINLLHFDLGVHLVHISSRSSILIILLLFAQEISIARDDLGTLDQKLVHRLLMRLQVSTALGSLKMDLLHTVSRVTEHRVSLFVLMVGAVSWKCHCDALDLQKPDEAVWIYDPCRHWALLVLIVHSGASIKLGLLDNERRWLWTVLLKHPSHQN